MASLNRVFLIGNLTRDPELRYIPSGTAVTDIGLAVNRNWTGQDGQKHEEATFVDITLWARQAEIASEYLHKGDPVFIEGRLQLDQWTDKEGQKRSRLRVVGERMQFLSSRGAPREEISPAHGTSSPEGREGPEGPPPQTPPESEIPF